MSAHPGPSLLVISPQRPPGGSCGLADHAACLAGELRQRGWQVAISGLEALDTNPSGPLLLQYTPYAYSRLGLPLFLLLRLLRLRWRWRQQRRHAPAGQQTLLVFFHELPFLNRSGWKGRLIMPLQRLICLLLVQLSSQALVNQASALAWLGWLRPRRPPQFLPCWSNVGEDPEPPPPGERPLRVAVFGSAGKRRHAHQLVARRGGYLQLFGAAVQVLDIGEAVPLPAALTAEVHQLGPLPAPEIRQILVQCRYGWFYAEPDQVAKSGVFAAYCALGVVPVLAFAGAAPDPLFLAPSELPLASIPAARLEELWQGGRAWFQQHALARGTDRIEQLLRPC